MPWTEQELETIVKPNAEFPFVSFTLLVHRILVYMSISLEELMKQLCECGVSRGRCDHYRRPADLQCCEVSMPEAEDVCPFLFGSVERDSLVLASYRDGVPVRLRDVPRVDLQRSAKSPYCGVGP